MHPKIKLQIFVIIVSVVLFSLWFSFNKKAKEAVNTDNNKIISTDSNAQVGKEIILGDKETASGAGDNATIPYVAEDVIKETKGTFDKDNNNTTRPSDELEELSRETSSSDEEVGQYTGKVESISGDTYNLVIELTTKNLKVSVDKSNIDNLDITLKAGDTFVMQAFLNSPIVDDNDKMSINKIKSLLSVETNAVLWNKLDSQENEKESE